MSEKFKDVPIEQDITITFETEAKLGDLDVLYQKWIWNGITAESMIFIATDVDHLNDQELEQEVRSSPMVIPESKITVSRSHAAYAFVNFNFKTND